MEDLRELLVERPVECPYGRALVSGRLCTNPQGPALCTADEKFPEDCPLTHVIGDATE